MASITDDFTMQARVEKFIEQMMDKRNQVVVEFEYQYDRENFNNKIIVATTDKSTGGRTEWNGFVASTALSEGFDVSMKAVRWHRVVDGVFQTRHAFEEDHNGLIVCKKCGEFQTAGNRKDQCPGDKQIGGYDDK